MPFQPRYPRTVRVLDDSAKERVKEAIDLREYVANLMEVRKVGATVRCRCPFHDERTASFVVHERFWHCFGACGTGGDLFSFDMAVNKYSFSASLKHLAEYAGIPLQNDQPIDSKVLARRRAHAAREAERCQRFWYGWLPDLFGERYPGLADMVETAQAQAYDLVVACGDEPGLPDFNPDFERLCRLKYLIQAASPAALKESYEMLKNLPPETVLLAWTRTSA